MVRALETLFGVPADRYKAFQVPKLSSFAFRNSRALPHLKTFTSKTFSIYPSLDRKTFLIIIMSEVQPKETVVSDQPPPQAQPSTISKLQASTGTEEWSDDIFNCFEGPDNLCKLVLEDD